ncbi:unnamed protein product, partial [Pelagomonas calceolata]
LCRHHYHLPSQLELPRETRCARRGRGSQRLGRRRVFARELGVQRLARLGKGVRPGRRATAIVVRRREAGRRLGGRSDVRGIRITFHGNPVVARRVGVAPRRRRSLSALGRVHALEAPRGGGACSHPKAAPTNVPGVFAVHACRDGVYVRELCEIAYCDSLVRAVRWDERLIGLAACKTLAPKPKS